MMWKESEEGPEKDWSRGEMSVTMVGYDKVDQRSYIQTFRPNTFPTSHSLVAFGLLTKSGISMGERCPNRVGDIEHLHLMMVTVRLFTL